MPANVQVKGKNKLIPRLMGISKDAVMRVDERTKEVQRLVAVSLSLSRAGLHSPCSSYLCSLLICCRICIYISKHIDDSVHIHTLFRHLSQTHPAVLPQCYSCHRSREQILSCSMQCSRLHRTFASMALIFASIALHTLFPDLVRATLTVRSSRHGR